jgi:perosamine synthetase
MNAMKYPIYTPDIARYTASAHSALDAGWISSQGEYIDKARDLIKSRVGTPYAVLMNNGTSATHMLYKALRFKYPSISRVYLPNHVFVAVWNCALYEYSTDRLELIETDPNTLNMRVDEDYIRSLVPGAAVVVVHNVGNVVNVPRLKRLRPDLVFVEDCCEAFLDTYEGKTTGTESLCAAVSFFGNKIITSGEGGVFYTHDKDLYDFVYKSCHHGMTDQRYIYDVLGYNYRMTNIQAALLYDQFLDADAILARKRAVYERYVTLFGAHTATTGIWMFIARLPGVSQAALADRGIDTRPMFYPASRHAHLKLEGAECAIGHEDLMMLPSSPSLTAFDQVWIANVVQQVRAGICLEIVKATPSLINTFCQTTLPPSFRYFSTRPTSVCDSHTLTLIGLVDGVPAGYAHIDDRWVGLCVLPEFQGKSFGRTLLNFVVAYARVCGLSLRLSVDADNDPAISLYESVGFTCTTRSTHLLMEKTI